MRVTSEGGADRDRTSRHRQDRGHRGAESQPRCNRSRSTSADPNHQHAGRRHQAERRPEIRQRPVRRCRRCRHAGSANWRPERSGRTAAKNTTPSSQRLVSFRYGFVRHSFATSQNRPPAIDRPGSRRSHSPNRGDRCDRPDSSYGSPRPLPRRNASPPISSANANVAALSIHINGRMQHEAPVHAEIQRDSAWPSACRRGNPDSRNSRSRTCRHEVLHVPRR